MQHPALIAAFSLATLVIVRRYEPPSNLTWFERWLLRLWLLVLTGWCLASIWVLSRLVQLLRRWD